MLEDLVKRYREAQRERCPNQNCNGCEFNAPMFEWDEEPKLCTWLQELDEKGE